MPDIHFECSKCTQVLDAPVELSGQMIECPTCREMIEVPIRTRQDEPPKPPESKTKPQPTTTAVSAPAVQTLPSIETSDPVANALFAAGALELLAAPLAGLSVGQDSKLLGWTVFFSGLVSGLILLGFGKIIEYLSETTQSLQRIEFLLRMANIQKVPSDEPVQPRAPSLTAK